MASVCTRFAPSPTGFLHIGGARTALFNYLFARHHGGKFILRIEDTDRERSTPEAIEAIIQSLKWLQLGWDEGPYFQSQRMPLYKEKIEKLLAEGKAYPCICTSEEIEAKRQAAQKAKKKPAYDGTCRPREGCALRLPQGKPYTVRFLAPKSGTTVVEDKIKGKVVFENSELDDLIIARSNGTPTYNFCVVVDDIDMAISHIIRGDDHLANTPRQILLYQALGCSPPQFAHVPLILGLDRSRLSKRHGATSVMAYRDTGYFPEALINYLVRLGWSHGDQEIFSRDELIDKFALEDVGKSAGVFNAEKLLWLNSHYIKECPLPLLAQEVRPFIDQKGTTLNSESGWLEKMVATLQPRAKTLVELVESAHFYLSNEISLDAKAQAKFLTPAIRPVLSQLRERLAQLPAWELTPIHGTFEEVIHEHHLGLGKIAQPVRVALTGGTASPGIFEIMEVLGRDLTLSRLDRALTMIGKDPVSGP